MRLYRALCLALVTLAWLTNAPAAIAQGPEINHVVTGDLRLSAIKGPVFVDGDDQAVVGVVKDALVSNDIQVVQDGGDAATTLVVKSIINAMPTAALIQEKSISSILEGEPFSNSKFKHAQCGYVANDATKNIAGAVPYGDMVAIAMSRGASVANAGGLGTFAGMAGSFLTPSTREINCGEEISACPLEILCVIDETAWTRISVMENGQESLWRHIVSTRNGRGYESKRVAEAHLEKLRMVLEEKLQTTSKGGG